LTLFDLLFGARTWRAPAKVVITDVTRMQDNRVCIAALHRRARIRLHEPQPEEVWLRSVGGLGPGDVVSLSWKTPRHVRRPHIEDADWNPASLEKVDRLPEDELVRQMTALAFSSLQDAFGKPCFFSDDGNAAFPPDKGSRSLAFLMVNSVRAYSYGDGVRVDFRDSDREWTMAPFEDLRVRIHQVQCGSCSAGLSESLTSEFEGREALLGVGLGRPFQYGDNPAACYLQVNHIFLIPSRRKHFALSLRSSP